MNTKMNTRKIAVAVVLGVIALAFLVGMNVYQRSVQQAQEIAGFVGLAGLERLAARARWAADKGCVHLIQERLGPDTYSYVAIARPRAPGARSPLADIELAEVA